MIWVGNYYSLRWKAVKEIIHTNTYSGNNHNKVAVYKTEHGGKDGNFEHS